MPVRNQKLQFTLSSDTEPERKIFCLFCGIDNRDCDLRNITIMTIRQKAKNSQLSSSIYIFHMFYWARYL